MIISHKHRFIFIRPRKVAGTSVESNLARHCGPDDIITRNSEPTRKDDEESYTNHPQNNEGFSPHETPHSIQNKVPQKVWQDYLKITIVRNPWDMVVSRYKWKRSTPDRLRSDKPLANIKKRALLKPSTYLKALKALGVRVGIIPLQRDFEKFVQNQGDTGFNNVFYFDPAGNPVADYYIRFEHLEKDYKQLCQKLNIPYERLPRLKTKSRKKKEHYSEFHNEKTRKIVAQRAQHLISHFNYRFFES